MSTTRKRLTLWGSLLLVGTALGLLVFSSFNDALVYFYTPTEVIAQSTELTDSRIRIGGMVQEGSLRREEGTLRIHFEVTDGESRLPVFYEGMTPDLFREGQGVVVEGAWKPGTVFTADTILAKHSEDYIPVEMSEEGIAKSRESILNSLQ
ncbi:MAG: cytochrome c maturation protein CcmE [Magnetococcales bacterium]|nr:cytochrome c maturation protein CcmE [Magnetococcales bacterium]